MLNFENIPKDIKLVPALEACRMNTGKFEIISHPLVMSVPFFGSPLEIHHANECLRMKKTLIQENLEARDFRSYVFLHERPYRYNALARVLDKVMPKADRLELIKDTYVDSENIRQNLRGWKAIFRPFVGADSWCTMGHLPDTFTVYRGGNKSGVAWTLNRDKAIWFGSRFRSGALWQARAIKSKGIAYFTDRDEDEIVVLSEHLLDLKNLGRANHYQS